jgi:hypothetical protein
MSLKCGQETFFSTFETITVQAKYCRGVNEWAAVAILTQKIIADSRRALVLGMRGLSGPIREAQPRELICAKPS